MAVESTGIDVTHALALLGAGVLAVPLFRRLGLGSVLGYLAAGLLLGPYGVGLIRDPQGLLHMAELGVVLFLFVIGLEMRPSRLWALRGDIFGLGVAQVLACGALLTGLAWLAGIPLVAAAIGAMGFVLSSTAVIMQMLDERGQRSTPAGQRAVAVLLLEDIAIVPLLAAVALLASAGADASAGASGARWVSVLLSLAVLASVIAAGRWLMDPLFRVLARAGAREVMTAGALLVVLGTALLMQWGGLSMAMGAFLAGVLLAESTFRHQLEADIEPFRGLLLGLFFMSVGMSLDLGVVATEWRVVLGGVVGFMIVKALGIYVVARAFGAAHPEARERATLFAQGGEFAFVLYGAALAAGLLDARLAAVMTAVVILSMALTPLVTIAADRLVARSPVSLDGIDAADGLSSRVVIIGFGRFSQIVSQPLLARGCEISLIEVDVDMIRAAADFGFKVYYGDGTRLDVLRASGAENAQAILVCVDDPKATDRIVELCKAEFPHARLFARAFDRGHVLRLIEAGVDYHVRETFESAIAFGHAVLRELGATQAEADDVIADVRLRDEERLALQVAGGIKAGRALMRGNLQTPVPTPLTVPRRGGQALNDAAAQAMAGRAPAGAAAPD
jgi:glutathione-regulated potassium-efflux system protein KefB